MIRVNLAPEPPGFDLAVRQRGLSAIAELIGLPPTIKRSGPRRKKIANRREDIPPESFPDYWTAAIDDLLRAYRRICAYVCCYIEPITGMPTVDHMIPKTLKWEHAYEWSNFRLACHLMNARKSDMTHVLDPFDVEDGWFELELVGFGLKCCASVDAELQRRIADTIETLGLNRSDCRDLRQAYAEAYWERHITWDYLHRRAPFVAAELKRQDCLVVDDSPT